MPIYQHHNSTDEPHYAGLEQLMSMALADPTFAAALIHEPCHIMHHKMALIHLSSKEQDIICSIRNTEDIYEFAAQLYDLLYKT